MGYIDELLGENYEDEENMDDGYITNEEREKYSNMLHDIYKNINEKILDVLKEEKMSKEVERDYTDLIDKYKMQIRECKEDYKILVKKQIKTYDIGWLEENGFDSYMTYIRPDDTKCLLKVYVYYNSKQGALCCKYYDEDMKLSKYNYYVPTYKLDELIERACF